MDKEIKKHLIAYNKKNGWNIEDDSLIETLFESGDELYHDVIDSRRWWDDVFVVKKIDGMLIGYMDAKTTGDRSPREVGWEFDKDTICKVKPVEKTITIYEKC